MNTYRKRLSDPRWQRKRLEIFQRDNFTCRKCNSAEKELHVHHVAYDNKYEIWAQPDYTYATLCFECHYNEEARLKEMPERIMKVFRLAGITGKELSDIEMIFRNLSDNPEQTKRMVQLMFYFSVASEHEQHQFLLFINSLKLKRA